jgi:uncharacterized membrane protein
MSFKNDKREDFQNNEVKVMHKDSGLKDAYIKVYLVPRTYS